MTVAMAMHVFASPPPTSASLREAANRSKRQRLWRTWVGVPGKPALPTWVLAMLLMVQGKPVWVRRF